MRQFPSFFIGKLALFSCLIIVCFGSSEAQTINNLDPPSIPAGYPFPTLTLEVNGSGFAIGSVVDWNGSPLATTFVTATQLTASVPRTLYQSPGTASVTVQTGATISNGATFTIGPPVPTVTSTTPAYAIAGGPGFTLTINGTGFVPGSTADFLSPVATSVAQPVTFVSATQVTLFVPASQIASPGSYELVVYYPQYTNPSTLYPFTVYPAGVNISSLSPSALAAGFPFPTLQMTVNGSGFANGAMVEWNGSPLPTTFVSFTQLTASIPTALIASPGTATVTVVSGGATSNAEKFTIGPLPPTVTSTVPASANAGGPGFTLTINGTGFVPQSSVQFGCNDATTLSSTFVSATQLTAFVPASLIVSPGLCYFGVNSPQSSGPVLSPIYTFTLNPAVKLSVLTVSPLPSGTVDVPYTLALSATGGVPPYNNWTLTSGSLPPGMSLSSPGGLIAGLVTGVPTSAGTFPFTVQVSDSTNATASTALSLTIVQVPIISANGILNAASYATGGVAPGEMITIFGSGLGPATLAPLATDARGYVATSLGGTQVLFDGTPAPLIYSLADQVSAIVPYETFGKSSTQVQVVFQGQSSSTVSVPVVTAAPAIFTLNSSGSGPGAIVNQNGTVNSAINPASAGSIAIIFATGEGQTNPDGTDGKLDGFPAPAPVAQPVTATIGGLNAEVQYIGGVPGLVAGFLQVNVRIPSSVPAGSAVPVIISIAGASSQANVTLAVGPPSAQ
jgi:uncharacterized protein (TIGR03437 family)